MRTSRTALQRVVIGAVAAAALATSGLVSAQPAAAAPLFQAPFACGETWRGATRSDHNDYDSIDFNWGAGSDDYLRPVHASAAGKVVGSGVYNDGVSYVLVDHGGGWATRYLHMQTSSMLPVGTSVRIGDVVGKVSDVGSPGAYHLHYEQRYNGEIVAAKFNGVTFDYPTQDITSKNCGGSPSGGFGDWSGDGKPDVLARESSSGDVFLYKGSGTGGFQAGSTKAGSGWGGMNAILRHGDWDGDGAEDVLARETATGGLFLYRGQGDGTFKTGRTQIGTGWSGYTPVAAGDWDGDGDADLLAKENATGALYRYDNNGSGGIEAGTTKIGTGWGGYDHLTGVGDFDGDGDNDLVARETATGDLYLYRGNGTGGIETGSTRIGTGWGGIDAVIGAGDFDGDGDNDILGRAAATGNLYLYRGNGTGGLTTGTTQIGTGWNSYTPLF